MARRSQGLFSCCAPFLRRYFFAQAKRCRCPARQSAPRPERGGCPERKTAVPIFLCPQAEHGKILTRANIIIIPQKMLLVNTLSEGFRNFSLLHKNVLKASAKMSIEKCENICYNEITKQEEVQSDETLISTTFIHKISSFVHNDSGTDTHHSSYREIF